MKAELSASFVRQVGGGGSRRSFFDVRVPGLELRVGASGHKSFYVFYRAGKGRSAPLRRYHLGAHPGMSLAKARKAAMDVLSRALSGEDPARDRRKEREAPSVRELLGRFEAEYVEARTKPGTRMTYRSIIANHIVPSLGGLKVTGVRAEDLKRLHTDMRGTPYAANRAVAILKTFLNWAAELGYRPTGANPASLVRPYREERRQDCPDAAQLARIGAAMGELAEGGRLCAHSEAAIKLLMLTGARKNEILRLEWEDVDYPNSALRIRDSKTGFKTVRLPAPALDILKGIPEGGNRHVFPGRGGRGHLSDLKHPWKRVLAKAGLAGRWRIHDLRHAYASTAVNAGASLPLIGHLLGHRNAQTTARYAHVFQGAAIEIAEMTGERISRALGPGSPQP
jgi:integrase